MTETQQSLLFHFHARCLACTIPSSVPYSGVVHVCQIYLHNNSIPFGSAHAGDIDKRRFSEQWSSVLSQNPGITTQVPPASHRPGEYWLDGPLMTRLCGLPDLEECYSHLWTANVEFNGEHTVGAELTPSVPHVEALLTLSGHLSFGGGFTITEKGCRALLPHYVEVPDYVLDGAVNDYGIECRRQTYLWKFAQQFRPSKIRSFPECPPKLQQQIAIARNQLTGEAKQVLKGSSFIWR